MISVQFILNFFPVKTREIEDGKTFVVKCMGEGLLLILVFLNWFGIKFQKCLINNVSMKVSFINLFPSL